ncbi:MAG: DNA primase [Candidatus Moranbacteria bacterium RIFCSPHIGHO2_01_FULL_54_31]|nr:MAG: DNA primase [Candidatus Moranbacteria bacterium RIFCSPHIGHO2_01_FULL_54_31]
MSTGTTEEIKARLNIVELIGSYVRLEKSGQHWKACCPFHQERTPSFMVNEEKAMWHCFGCGKGGDVFAFVMEMEGLEFREALKMLAERAGVELPQYKGETQNKETKDRIYDLLELATKFYEKQLQGGVGKEKILSYLTGRGLSAESIGKFRLGYAPDGWRHTLDFLVGRGFRPEEIEQAGLILKKDGGGGYYDRFRDRIMFPIFDILGRVIGYSARVTPGGDESQAKYINTPETPIYHKSRALYGLFQGKQAMKQAGATVIVEGNVDVIAMHQAGIGNTVAVSGTALTPEQLTIMKRYGNEVRLFFDMDGAGQKAARKSAELALEKELLVSVIALTSGKDAADMGQESPEKLREAVAQSVPALKYFLEASLAKNDRTTPDGKRKIVDEYTELLLFVKNPIERAHWIKELAREIQMEEKLVVGVVNAAFLARERREHYNVPQAGAPVSTQGGASFGKRSELLREELVGFMYADAAVRQALLALLADGETKAFLEKHPLYFFLIQAGTGDPLSLIEDAALKSEATKLIFRVLALPDFIDVAAGERIAKMLAIAQGYLEKLTTEITKREKLIALERAIGEAREKKDKALETKLVTQFTEISLDKS